MGPLTARKLTGHDDLTHFDSTEPELDQWLRAYALSDQRAGASVTHVLPRGDRVVGFHTLAPHSIKAGKGRLGKGLPRDRPVAVYLLARLAVDKSVHGAGLGGGLLHDALLRCLAWAEEFGGRAVLAGAKHEKAAGFYKRHGFIELPGDDRCLYRLMKDIRRSAVEAVESARARSSEA